MYVKVYLINVNNGLIKTYTCIGDLESLYGCTIENSPVCNNWWRNLQDQSRQIRVVGGLISFLFCLTVTHMMKNWILISPHSHISAQASETGCKLIQEHVINNFKMERLESNNKDWSTKQPSTCYLQKREFPQAGLA